MPDRFMLLVEARRPIAMATLPPGRAIGCGGCQEVLTGLFWARPEDLADPYDAPVWCTACALCYGRVVVVRVDPASGDDQTWQPDPAPEPDMVTVVFPGGVAASVERSTLQWEGDGTFPKNALPWHGHRYDCLCSVTGVIEPAPESDDA